MNSTVPTSAQTQSLAPWAQHAEHSRGRAHPEPPHPFRGDYQRDCARIIHSKAFRRLELKTQVFLTGTGDHFRNRLTHTIEVASISRTIARALNLNEDLAEAVALAHDLGHPPFGHTGEETLDRLMHHHGGFEHNRQSLRIVTFLEQKYPGIPGLNLSFEVLEGLRKHDRNLEFPDGTRYRHTSLEAQIANASDEIAYYSHDLDDGLDAGLLRAGQLEEVQLWRETRETLLESHPQLTGKLLQAYVIRCLIDREVQDLIRASDRRIRESGIESADDARRHPSPLIEGSPALRQANQQLRNFLYANLYHHPRVTTRNAAACAKLETLFQSFEQNPDLLGRDATTRLESEGLHRTICDYLSGMTDSYLERTFRRLQARTRESKL